MKKRVQKILLFLLVLLLVGCSDIPSRKKVFQMSDFALFSCASQVQLDVSEEKIHKAWGEPDSFFSGFYGDIYLSPENEEKAIGIYYDGDTRTVIEIVFFDRQK